MLLVVLRKSAYETWLFQRNQAFADMVRSPVGMHPCKHEVFTDCFRVRILATNFLRTYNLSVAGGSRLLGMEVLVSRQMSAAHLVA